MDINFFVCNSNNYYPDFINIAKIAYFHQRLLNSLNALSGYFSEVDGHGRISLMHINETVIVMRNSLF